MTLRRRGNSELESVREQVLRDNYIPYRNWTRCNAVQYSIVHCVATVAYCTIVFAIRFSVEHKGRACDPRERKNTGRQGIGTRSISMVYMK